MIILTSKNFEKGIIKLNTKVYKKFKERRDLFVRDIFNKLLCNHKLDGKYKGCRSFNISGDYRVIYKEVSKDTYLFLKIGTHSELCE